MKMTTVTKRATTTTNCPRPGTPTAPENTYPWKGDDEGHMLPATRTVTGTTPSRQRRMQRQRHSRQRPTELPGAPLWFIRLPRNPRDTDTDGQGPRRGVSVAVCFHKFLRRVRPRLRSMQRAWVHWQSLPDTMLQFFLVYPCSASYASGYSAPFVVSSSAEP